MEGARADVEAAVRASIDLIHEIVREVCSAVMTAESVSYLGAGDESVAVAHHARRAVEPRVHRFSHITLLALDDVMTSKAVRRQPRELEILQHIKDEALRLVGRYLPAVLRELERVCACRGSERQELLEVRCGGTAAFVCCHVMQWKPTWHLHMPRAHCCIIPWPRASLCASRMLCKGALRVWALDGRTRPRAVQGMAQDDLQKLALAAGQVASEMEEPDAIPDVRLLCTVAVAHEDIHAVLAAKATAEDPAERPQRSGLERGVAAFIKELVPLSDQIARRGKILRCARASAPAAFAYRPPVSDARLDSRRAFVR